VIDLFERIVVHLADVRAPGACRAAPDPKVTGRPDTPDYWEMVYVKSVTIAVSAAGAVPVRVHVRATSEASVPRAIAVASDFEVWSAAVQVASTAGV
jgi:hypothetical protein